MPDTETTQPPEVTDERMPYDLKHLAADHDGREWWGCLTIENAEALKDRIERMLKGRLYTFVARNDGFLAQCPEVRTSQKMREAHVSCDDLAHVSVSDSYGSWGILSQIKSRAEGLRLSADERRTKGAYVVIRHDRIEIEHSAPAGHALFWVIAVEHPEYLSDDYR